MAGPHITGLPFAHGGLNIQTLVDYIASAGGGGGGGSGTPFRLLSFAELNAITPVLTTNGGANISAPSNASTHTLQLAVPTGAIEMSIFDLTTLYSATFEQRTPLVVSISGTPDNTNNTNVAGALLGAWNGAATNAPFAGGILAGDVSASNSRMLALGFPINMSTGATGSATISPEIFATDATFLCTAGGAVDTAGSEAYASAQRIVSVSNIAPQSRSINVAVTGFTPSKNYLALYGQSASAGWNAQIAIWVPSI